MLTEVVEGAAPHMKRKTNVNTPYVELLLTFLDAKEGSKTVSLFSLVRSHISEQNMELGKS